MTWNHRVIAYREGKEFWYEIVEVHYNEKGVPKMHSSVADVGANTLKDLDWQLDRLKECLSKPILSAENFPEEFKPEEQ